MFETHENVQKREEILKTVKLWYSFVGRVGHHDPKKKHPEILSPGRIAFVGFARFLENGTPKGSPKNNLRPKNLPLSVHGTRCKISSIEWCFATTKPL